ncbi:Scr1 family TA system antitoxin-like transcriptional regulator [Amycolatopsis sp. NPDC101161]|uniref:Scr1 family TA system antitoxin-like transcriptional regulator n=1 Tax=Amycolatopsis sp. NPDC101161 TaxID=3363940 RepID=UPI0038035589
MKRRHTTYVPQRGSAEHKPAALGFGLTLSQLRIARGLSMRALSHKIGSYPQQVFSWEHGRIPDPADAAFIAGTLGAHHTTAQRIIDHARQAALNNLVDTDHREHAAIAWHYEHLADHTTIWAPTLIPDLLRIPALDLGLLNHPLVNHDHVDAHADAMPQRRADLADPRRRYTILIGDTALQSCPEHLRTDQLDHLATQATRPNITILLLSHQACPPGLIAPFILFSINSAAIAVATHHGHATTYLTDRDALTRYCATATWLRKTASTIETSQAQNRQTATPPLHEHPAPSEPTPRLATMASPTPPPPARPPRPPHDVAAPSMLGPHVTRLRTARELDLPELAAVTDISEATLCRLERGIHIAFGLAEIAALADALGVSRTDFAGLAVGDYSRRHGPPPTEPLMDLTPDPDLDQPAGWLRAEREARDLTTTTLAWRAGILRRVYRQLEADEMPAKLSHAVQLADALHVSRHALVARAISGIRTRKSRDEPPRMGRSDQS